MVRRPENLPCGRGKKPLRGHKNAEKPCYCRRNMAENQIYTKFSRDSHRRRRVAVVAAAVIASSVATPTALACAQHQPASFWSKALKSLAVTKTAKAAETREQPK